MTHLELYVNHLRVADIVVAFVHASAVRPRLDGLPEGGTVALGAVLDVADGRVRPLLEWVPQVDFCRRVRTAVLQLALEAPVCRPFRLLLLLEVLKAAKRLDAGHLFCAHPIEYN